MGNQEHGFSLCFHLVNRLVKRVFTRIVQIGIGLIQHNQLGVAIHGARQTNALALPA